MSARDHVRDSRKLAPLVGRRCFLTVAVNSLKVHIDENIKDGIYLWIDPPWHFGRHTKLITASNTCPNWRTKGYQKKFKTWSAELQPVFDTLLVSASSSRGGALALKFKGGYEIRTPEGLDLDENEMGYDQWYVRLHPPRAKAS